MVDPAFWSGKRVFLTGHTGFKGAWLTLWLRAMDATVKGYALPPDTDPSLFTIADVARGIESEFGDIRDLDQLRRSVAAFAPDILIHMAAQPLVRLAYRDPVGTYATNVMGTVHVLEAARDNPALQAIVSVTTDKCYENKEWVWGYRETEAMGGHDPYSSSKGCAELVSAAYRASFFNAPGAPALATARAGNVIGGGDWAEDRLVPDILRRSRRTSRCRSATRSPPDPGSMSWSPCRAIWFSLRPCTNAAATLPRAGISGHAKRMRGPSSGSSTAWSRAGAGARTGPGTRPIIRMRRAT
jgi:CDP-glucose 4,6-dehydratase